MSARGCLVFNPGPRSKVVAESKRCIPLLWLSFLSLDDIEEAETYGQFRLDRKRAVGRSSDSLPFLASLFPHVPSFEEYADSLLQKLRAGKGKTIGIEVADLVGQDDADPNPDLRTAVGVIENRDAHFSLTVPARTFFNPFTREESRAEERRIKSTQDMLLEVCGIPSADLASRSQDLVRETLLGHVYPGQGLIP